MSTGNHNPAPLPFAADCKTLPWNAPFSWLRLGWQDLRAARNTSLSYGAIMVLISYAISLAAWKLGNLGLLIGMLSGFVFLGPLLALRVYAISARLANGAPVSLRATYRDAYAALSDTLVFALILLIVFLIWARAAAMVHVFFPVGSAPDAMDWLGFLGVGSAVGALFCAFIFVASAFALPMMADRKTDTVTAVVTSINACLRNKPAMAVWAGCIGLFVVLGIGTAFLGFAVLLPWLGHAAWHGYRETIDASPWPARHASASPNAKL